MGDLNVDKISFGWQDVISPFIIFLLVMFFAKRAQAKNHDIEYYKYYRIGLMLKILGGVLFCFVYVYYYVYGDTIVYFRSSCFLVNLAGKDFGQYWDILINGAEQVKYSYFDSTTGYPAWYMFRDPNTFFVVRFISPLVFITGQSYLATTMLMSLFSYAGIWQLYKLLLNYYHMAFKEVSFAVLFFPSVVFWGSGIMKDTITLSCVAWYTYSFHQVVIMRKLNIKYIIIMLISSSLIIAIKPYIFMALMPGSLIWGTFDLVKSVKNQIIRVLIAPFIIISTFFGGGAVLSNLSSKMGEYGSVDAAISKAVVTQRDLKREEYGGNSFDIGDFEPTIGGILSKAPIAIVSGLFRPFIWEVRNGLMLLSALENLLLVYLLLSSVFKVGFFKYLNIIRSDPFIMFMMIFSIFFAFSIGLTTANFGALVRYKIPLIPFLVSAIFIVNRKVAKEQMLS
ncbi:MAG: hypothetical protein WCK02_08865 [Bacteroidota bacterium]